MARQKVEASPTLDLPPPTVVPVDFEHDPDDRLVTPEDIQRWLGISRYVMYSMMRDKTSSGLPRPMKLGRTSRWRLGTLRRWIQERDRATARQRRQ